MTPSPLILDYATLRPRPGTRLALDEPAAEPARVRVLFAVSPRWAFLFYAAGWLLLGTLPGLLAIANYQRGEPDELPLEGMDFFLGIIVPGFAAFITVGLAASASWRMVRWVREHRVLVVTGKGLLLSRVGFWRLHQKWWPVDQIQAIELRRVPGSVQVIETVRYLIVQFTNGTSRRFYLNTPDRTLPERIAERFSATLGCPLQTRE